MTHLGTGQADAWIRLVKNRISGAFFGGPNGSDNIKSVISVRHHSLKVELEPGVAGLVPPTEISWSPLKTRPEAAFTPGQEVVALVLAINCHQHKMTLSLRQLLPDPWDQAGAKYPVGTRVKGLVYHLTAYGAFVKIAEGVVGLVHVSQLSWLKKIEHPSACLKIGDEVEAVVLAVDQANRRLALGIKQLAPDPWATIDQLYKVGDLVRGNVVKLAKYGAFVELQSGLQGLVHISRISEPPVAKVADVLAVGQAVNAYIMKIDHAEKLIGLSLLEMVNLRKQ